MLDDIIGMYEMGLIFGVTDPLGVDREKLTVPLGKEGRGSVQRLPTGEVEIVVPAEIPLEEWLDTLRDELQKLGFEPEE